MAQQFAEGARYTPDYIPTWVDKYWDTYRESAEAAITAYDPDKRLREALEAARHYIANCWIDPVAAEEEHALVAKIDAALSHNGG